MKFRRKRPIEIDHFELEARVLGFREALIKNPSSLGAEDFLDTQPDEMKWPIQEGLKNLFENTPKELISNEEMHAVGLYLLSIYGD